MTDYPSAFYILKDLAIIFLFAKLFAILARKLKAPQVVGEIIAGILIGPAVFGWVGQTDFLKYMSEIGVILLMFSAGLGTNLKELIKTGPIALFIAVLGVFVPLAGGTVMTLCFDGFAPFGSEEFLKAVFIGTIMTATSVGITVEALKEMGYLSGRVGTTILSAAIIDDVIGIIVLTFVLGMKSGDTGMGEVLLKTLLFIVFTIIVGYLVYRLFKLIDAKYTHTRRIPIFGLVLCFALAFAAEYFFGIADITGAFAAGIILCNIHDSDYIARKMDINSYMFFGPIFFASIGLKTTFAFSNTEIIWFSIAFVIVAMVTKIIGCGLAAKICRFKMSDSLKIGFGMMTRGEVALIVSQKGLEAGILSSEYFAAVILLIIVSSITVPIILKLMYEKYPENNLMRQSQNS